MQNKNEIINSISENKRYNNERFLDITGVLDDVLLPQLRKQNLPSAYMLSSSCTFFYKTYSETNRAWLAVELYDSIVHRKNERIRKIIESNPNILFQPIIVNKKLITLMDVLANSYYIPVENRTFGTGFGPFPLDIFMNILNNKDSELKKAFVQQLSYYDRTREKGFWDSTLKVSDQTFANPAQIS